MAISSVRLLHDTSDVNTHCSRNRAQPRASIIKQTECSLHTDKGRIVPLGNLGLHSLRKSNIISRECSVKYTALMKQKDVVKYER